MTAPVMPVAVAVRKPGRIDGIDALVWVVKRCPFCSRRHVHTAPSGTLTELALPARCGDGTRAYRVVEEVAE